MYLLDQRSDVRPEIPRADVSLVFGAGASFAVGYNSGVAEALEQNGIIDQSTEKLGTSGGSIVAGCLAAGVKIDIGELPPIRRPCRDEGYLLGIISEALGDTEVSNVRTSAYRRPTWQRPFGVHQILDSRDFPLAHIIAASCSIPLTFRSSTVGKFRYLDGGVRSATSIDHAAPSTTTIAVVPLNRHVMPPIGRLTDTAARFEAATLTSRSGTNVITIGPNREIGSLVKNIDSLFDNGLAAEIQQMALEQTERIIRKRRDLQVLSARSAVRKALANY